jgi:hypothetical protein
MLKFQHLYNILIASIIEKAANETLLESRDNYSKHSVKNRVKGGGCPHILYFKQGNRAYA